MRKILLILLIVAYTLSLLFVSSRAQVNLTYQFDCYVTSTTALWTPGTHNFNLTCQGQLSSPINSTFTLNGTGMVTYSMVGGGSPPGELNLNMNLSGHLNDSFFNGPFNLSAVAHATTVLTSPTAGFIRTELVQNLTANGTFNEYTWNVTDQMATVDFSFIDPEGTAFQFRVLGTGQSSVIPEKFLPIVIIPLLTAAILLAAVVNRKSWRKEKFSAL